MIPPFPSWRMTRDMTSSSSVPSAMRTAFVPFFLRMGRSATRSTNSIMASSPVLFVEIDVVVQVRGVEELLRRLVGNATRLHRGSEQHQVERHLPAEGA